MNLSNNLSHGYHQERRSIDKVGRSRPSETRVNGGFATAKLYGRDADNRQDKVAGPSWLRVNFATEPVQLAPSSPAKCRRQWRERVARPYNDGRCRSCAGCRM